MLFDKIGRKFYSPDDETGAELHATGETIYSGDKPYLNTIYAPPLWTAFPEFNDIVLTPYLGASLSVGGGSRPPEDASH